MYHEDSKFIALSIILPYLYDKLIQLLLEEILMKSGSGSLMKYPALPAFVTIQKTGISIVSHLLPL